MSDQIKDGRPFTAAFVIVMGVASAALNVFGALNAFEHVAVYLFAIAVLGAECLALTVLRGINIDLSNNNYLKGILACFTFAGIVVLCFASGERAFHTLKEDSKVAYESKLAEVSRLQTFADEGFAAANAAETEQEKSRLHSSAEIRQKKADNARREATKMKPVPEWFVWLFLTIMELVKATGRYAFATKSEKKWTWRQRKIHNQKEKIKLAELKNNVVRLENAKKAA